MLIRPATQNDLAAIRRVIVDALTASEFGYGGEAEIVDRLHEYCNDLLSLVATDGDQIVGQILFSPVTIETASGITDGMGLAPMAVVPARRRTGVGTALVKSGLRQLAEQGCPFVVVLGHPAYYSRFGFQPAAKYGVAHGFDGIPQDAFLINVLAPDAARSIADGRASYRPEFGTQQHSGMRSTDHPSAAGGRNQRAVPPRITPMGTDDAPYS